jgi:hypothetical protein
VNAGDLIDEIAISPRAAGSAAEQEARDLCASYLTRHGFEVEIEEFGYSSFAGTLGTPAAGLILLAMFFAIPVVARSQAGTIAALATALAHLIALVLLSLRARPAAILGDDMLRRAGRNLVARASTVEPRLWLVAHLDSKSQPVSILLRSFGATLVALGGGALMLALLLSTAGVAIPGALLIVFSATGAAGSIPLLLSVVGNRSRGALDNASGVASVLVAAVQLHKGGESGFGVLITSAEELGLAGAHAFAAAHPPASAINCDSVDSVGDFICLSGRNAGGGVSRSLSRAAAASETPFRERRRLIGILVDSVALGAGGWDAVTLCRGTRASLARIHTRADVPKPGMGSAAEAAGSLIAAAARNFLAMR